MSGWSSSSCPTTGHQWPTLQGELRAWIYVAWLISSSTSSYAEPMCVCLCKRALTRLQEHVGQLHEVNSALKHHRCQLNYTLKHY